MDHGAGVAVKVTHKVVHYKVADHLVHIYHTLNILTLIQLLERGDEPVLVGVGDVGFGVVKDIGILVAILKILFNNI